MPRARWRRVGAVKEELAALALCNAKGDWRTEPVYEPEKLAEAEVARQSATGAAATTKARRTP